MKPVRLRASFRGHTLLELAIAMALGLLVVVAALTLYRGQRGAHDRAADIARMHEAASAALDLIGQQVQMAAFAPLGNESGAGLFGCSQGRPVGTVDALSCESLASHSDGVLIRYAADVVATWPSSSGAPTDCQGQAADAYVVNRFYAKASTSTGEPELYCEGVGKQAQPMVEGVERLRLAYWLDHATIAVDAASVPRDRWLSVAAVDVCVLVRGDPLASGKGKGQRYIDCDGTSVAATDSRARQAFWRRVAVRNALSTDIARPS